MDATLQPNGKYLISPASTPRRGEIQLVWQPQPSTSSSSSGGTNATNNAAINVSSGILKFEWKDRRTNAKDLESTVFPEDRCTFTKVHTGRDGDRVYLFQYGNSDRRHFFWLQDKNTDQDEELTSKFQTFLSDRAASIIEGGGTPAAGDSIASTATVAAAAVPPAAATAPSTGQVDALSSILENLGMPLLPTQQVQTQASGGGADSASTGRVLTLSDLQGAMAGLATHSPIASPAVGGPPLSEIASASAIEASGILDDPAVRQRLIDLLPEHQRTEEDLRENIRSPQVQQSLDTLTSALAGDMAAFQDVIVNFHMNPEDGAVALASGNPIQAFLDCLIASVEREGKEARDEEKMEE